MAVLAAVVLAFWWRGTAPAHAQEPLGATKVARLNKLALDAYDNLNFDQAKTFLEQALAEANTAALGRDPSTARTHLNMGMLLIAGFQQREQAVRHFKSALKLHPEISAPPGLFNPEVQAAFEEAKAATTEEIRTAPPPVKAPQRTIRPAGAPTDGPPPADGRASDSPSGEDEEDDDDDDDDNDADDDEETSPPARLLFSAGIGSGLGIARGKLDANRDLDSNGDGTADNQWSGGLAPTRLGHLVLGAGYYLSSALLLSLQGRLQIVSGTTIVKGEPGSGCAPSCEPPSTAFALFAKGDWFFSSGRLRPFVSGGIGGGAIRQVVKLNVAPTAGGPAASTGCGNTRTAACVDTVTGGPFWLLAGGGIAYEFGSLALLGALTTNLGIPKFMFNVDALLGLALRL